MHRSASNIRRMSTSLSQQSNSKSSCLGTLASSTEWWHAQGRDRTSQRADPSTQGTHPCLGESVYLDEDTYNHALEVHGTVQCLEPQIKTYDEKNILKKEHDQLLETLHTKMIGSIAADSNAEMNRVNAELYPDGSRKVCP